MIVTLSLVFLNVVLVLAILLVHKKNEKRSKRTIRRMGRR